MVPPCYHGDGPKAIHQSFRIERLLSESAAEGSPPCSMATRKKRADWSVSGESNKQKLGTTSPGVHDKSNKTSELGSEYKTHLLGTLTKT